MTYAQTNIQLYNQLMRDGRNEQDLRVVHAAYELALSLFAGQVRPNHRTFLSHLVAVASILAEAGADATIIAAGLLHSAYLLGEFGDGTRGMKEHKRRRVRRTLGAACEAIVARYAWFEWDFANITDLIANPKQLSPAEQVVVLVKLADTLDDHLDQGMHYAPQKKVIDPAESITAWREAIVELALSMGHNHLAEKLGQALDNSDSPRIPEFLRASEKSSFLVAPRSHGVRTSVRLGRAYRRWRAKVLPFQAPARKAA